MKKILSVVGARPNFIKIAPLHKVFRSCRDIVEHKICHTGQHFDESMSKIFFEELELPEPDFYLGISGGTQSVQAARIMVEFEKVVAEQRPDLIIVPGDVTSTMACSLVAAKMGIPLAHVESGLRSFDREMPEEINRMVTDVLSDYLFVSEPSGMVNLANEGISSEKMFLVGNIMIDSLISYLGKIKASEIVRQFGLDPGEYTVATFHRPSNVDDKENLLKLVEILRNLSSRKRVIFPVHPRTKENLGKYGIRLEEDPSLIIVPPLGYIDFIALVRDAMLVITDSGGIQEETTFLGVQCITVRDNTERPITVDIGTNQLIGTGFENILKASLSVLGGNKKEGKIPDLWDGKTAERIAEILIKKLA